MLFVTGNVTATDRTGSVRTLERAGSVEEGDTISTGEGRVQIEFKDGGYFALQPETRFRVDRYRYTSAGDTQDSVLVALVKGGLRTISGLVGKRNRSDYRLDTGVATIGIRGTDYALDLNSSLTGNVAEGAIEVCNGAGCLLVQAGQAFFVPSINQEPVLGERRALLPPTPRAQPGEAARSDQDGALDKRGPGEFPPQTLDRPPSATSLPGGPGHAGGGGPGASFDRLPGPAAGAAGGPPQHAAPGGGPAQGRTIAPGLTNKSDGGVPTTPGGSPAQGKTVAPGLNKGAGGLPDLSGPPGLIKKER
ncbi:MAG TPA: FecR family protein [Burkholderiales bacterium]|nr:FecR family protein [Burkholderiales bacterium]